MIIIHLAALDPWVQLARKGAAIDPTVQPANETTTPFIDNFLLAI